MYRSAERREPVRATTISWRTIQGTYREFMVVEQSQTEQKASGGSWWVRSPGRAGTHGECLLMGDTLYISKTNMSCQVKRAENSAPFLHDRGDSRRN